MQHAVFAAPITQQVSATPGGNRVDTAAFEELKTLNNPHSTQQFPQTVSGPISAVEKSAVPSLAASIVQIMHKNMMIDPGDLNKKRVKKDVLWKPLLRGFRSYFRNLLSQSVNLQQVMDPLATDLTVTLED